MAKHTATISPDAVAPSAGRLWRRFAGTLAGARGLWAALALALPALEPLSRPGIGYTADAAVHVYRVVELLRLWQDGILYSRWAPDLAYGLGYPLFNFYAPLFYYLAGTLHLLGLDVELAVKGALALAVLVGCAGTYGLVRQWFGQSSAVLAAIVYTWTPFHLREIYFQGDFAQLLAISLPPLILWGLHRLATTGRDRYFLATSLAYAALILSHNISAMLFSGVVVAYAAFLLLTRPAARRHVASVALALATGLALTAFFWFPALDEIRLVRLDALHSGDFDFRRHFPPTWGLLALPGVLDVNAVNPQLPDTVGLAHLAVALPSLLLLARRHLRGVVAFGWLGLLATMAMMLPHSTPLWQAVPLLAFTEFPVRWLNVAALALAFLAGAATTALPRGRAVYVALATLAVILSAFPGLYPREPFARYNQATVADILRYELAEGVVGTTSAGEYLPKGLDTAPRISSLLADYQAGRPPERLDLAALPAGAMASAVERAALGGRWQISSPAPFTARFFVLHYPGWTVHIDGRAASGVQADGEGLLTVPVPAGEHEVALRFVDTPGRQAATLASLLVALGLAMGLTIRRRAKARPGAPAGPAHEQPEPLAPQTPRHNAEVLSGRQALGIGLLGVGLLVAKVAYVDPQTTWFRAATDLARIPGLEHRLDVNFGDKVALLGYSVDREVAAAGDAVRVVLFWRALRPLGEDYASFVHLGDEHNDKLAQHDNSHPGGVPTRAWRPNQYARDEHLLRLPADMPPGFFQFRVGLYEQQSLQRLQVAGSPLNYASFLTPLRVGGPPPAAATAADFAFGDAIRLVGYRLADTAVRPGETASVHLYWQAGAPLATDYTVFVHLYDETGRLWGTGDRQPLAGQYPTSQWQPGEIVGDVQAVRLDPQAPPGSYRLAVGLYDLKTMRRLPLRGAPATGCPADAACLQPPLEAGKR